MSQKDIRSFFGGNARQSKSPGQSPSTTSPSSSRKSKRSARIIESDDEDDVKTTATEARSKHESNNNEAPSSTTSCPTSNDKVKPTKTNKLTEISADIFFGSQTPSRSFKPKKAKQSKVDNKSASPKISENAEVTGENESRLSGKLKKLRSEKYGLAGKENGQFSEKNDADVPDLSDQSCDPPTETPSKRKRTSDVNSAENDDDPSKNISDSSNSQIKQESGARSDNVPNSETPRKKLKRESKSTTDKTPKKNGNVTGKSNSEATTHTALVESTPSKSGRKSDTETVTPTGKQSPSNAGKTDLSVEEMQQRKAQNYRRFLERKAAQPVNPGTLEVPEGSPDCLTGLTLVITGLLDNIGREEAIELCRRLGARVTTAVSRNTSYLVQGSDPGQSKTDKARKLGTPLLDEAGLFDLIRSRTVSTEPPPAGDDVKQEPADVLHKPDSTKSEIDRGRAKSEASTGVKTAPTPTVLSQERSPPPDRLSQGSGVQEDQRLWVDKYRPATLKAVIGQQGDKSAANKLRQWLRNWNRFNTGPNRIKVKACAPGFGAEDGSNFRAAMLSGPPGVGKSTVAALVCAELGYDTVELNASDSRSKRLLEQYTDCLQSGTLASMTTSAGQHARAAFSFKHVLLMDEVDGMAGNEDRGGVAAIIQLLRTSRVPIICMCNDRQHQKIRSLAQYCFDLRVSRPRVEQIRAAMMSVCFREKLTVPRDQLDQLIVGSNQDVRQVLHMLSLLSADRALISSTHPGSKPANVKDMRLGVFDVVMKVFSAVQRQGMSCDDKIRLFFNDYSLGPLFVQENYLSVSPSARSQDGGRLSSRELLHRFSRAADSLCDGDVVDATLRQRQAWSLLPVYAVFNTLVPGELLAGHMTGRVQFPSWLGRNSSRNKTLRQLHELRRHACLRARAASDQHTLVLDYCRALRDHCTEPLLSLHRNAAQRSSAQADGTLARAVSGAAARLFSYDLQREDLDTLGDLCSWHDQSSSSSDPLANLDSKWKASFTRAVRGGQHIYPYSLAEGAIGGKLGGGSVDLLGEEDGETTADQVSGDEQEDNEDVSTDKMVKVKTNKKKAAGKKPAKESNAKENPPKNRGRQKK